MGEPLWRFVRFVVRVLLLDGSDFSLEFLSLTC